MSSLVNDPLFSSQWYLRNTGQSGGTPGIDLDLGNVWQNYTGTGVISASQGLSSGVTTAYAVSDPLQNNQTSLLAQS
jgi:hypothetical protein